MKDEIRKKNELWDRYYRTYRPTVLGRIMYNSQRKLLKKVMNEIPRTMKLIDIGCGKGSTLSSFRDWGFKNSIGIDLSTVGLNECEKIGFKIGSDVFLVDGTDTKYPSKSFDIVFSEGLLEHYEDFTPFIKEWCRISRDKVVIVQPNHFCLFSQVIQFLWDLFRQNSGGIKELTYRLEDFYKVFDLYGFDLVSTSFTQLKVNAVIVFESQDKRRESPDEDDAH